jgi:hypothetical protein
MGSTNHHPSTRNMRKVKAEFRAQCTAEDAKCWLCGMAIDYEADPNDEASKHRFQLDHYYPASTHPEHYEDPANFRPSGAECNRERGNKAPRPGLGMLSRKWA